MRSARWMLVAVVGIAVLAGTSASAWAEFKAGVVDTVYVVNEYSRTKDANDDLKTEMDSLRAVAEPKFKRVQELQLRRDGFNRSSDEWKKANEEFVKAQVDYQAWFLPEQAKIEWKHRDVLLDMYRQIGIESAKIAKAKGLDIVFTKAFLMPPQIDVNEAQGLDDLKQRIINQRILFPTNIADLTKDVLEALNAEYKPKKAPETKAPAAPAAPAPKG
ncbi:MAG: OmpH family outer membrane protein [Planctomycetota bacterium]|jgi:Skp family chaperone for outer membrane proteins|nr:OmpH family outer membrane protein [Planctomycetota bacterium]